MLWTAIGTGRSTNTRSRAIGIGTIARFVPLQQEDIRDPTNLDDPEAAPAQFRSRAGRDDQRHGAQERRHGRHHDRRKRSRQASKIARSRRQAALTLAFECKVDHHISILLDDADQKDDANEGDERELGFEELQRQERTDTGGRPWR